MATRRAGFVSIVLLALGVIALAYTASSCGGTSASPTPARRPSAAPGGSGAAARPAERTTAPVSERSAASELGVQLMQEGDLAGAARAFEEALKDAPGDPAIRRTLGRCYANLGVELLEKGDALTAEQVTRKACALLPEDPVVRLNLAACLDDRGYPGRAAVEVRKALAFGPELAQAHDRMATVHSREGRLEEAAVDWEKAAALAPADKGIAQRLADARASLAAEAKLSRQTSAHFEIVFDMEKDAVLASRVLQAMEEAHGVVGAELQHFGQERLVVVLLPTDAFQALTGAHGWVAGLFDGRIRLPVKDALPREGEVLARARHEYVHSVLAPLGNRAPGWLHEGLAQVFEGRSTAQALRRMSDSAALPYDAMTQPFSATRNADRARLLYDTALAFVGWLRDGVRGAGFRTAMAALFADETLDAAFRKGYDAELPQLYEKFQSSIRR